MLDLGWMLKLFLIMDEIVVDVVLRNDKDGYYFKIKI